jgi:hypothetical protein
VAKLTDTRQEEGRALAAPLIAALEDAWEAIRRSHPELPSAVLITGAGSGGGPRMLRLGHFAAGRWRPTNAETALPEIFIGGEGLARGAAPVLATLLHEAGHALAYVRGIKDTSRQGRYHNRRFKALAEELGLHIERAPGIGWSATTLPPATARCYAEAIAALEHAITLYRRREAVVAPGTPRPRRTVACICRCPRRIRVAPGVLARGPIVCTLCDRPFEADPVVKRSRSTSDGNAT